MGYPVSGVYAEVAHLAQRVHWTHEELMNLDHAERRRWVQETAAMDAR